MTDSGSALPAWKPLTMGRRGAVVTQHQLATQAGVDVLAGGDGQYQAALQVLSSVFDSGLDPQQAVEAPRWAHFQPRTGSVYPHQTPDVLLLESRVQEHVVDELKRRGHHVATTKPFDDPCTASCIVRDPTGFMLAGADPRRDGWAQAI